MTLVGGDIPPLLRRPTASTSSERADEAEAERFFIELAEGGTVGMPLQATFLAARYGEVISFDSLGDQPQEPHGGRRMN
jgi:PhnB protein